MGWKGTIRSIGAAVRAAERDAKRRQRELEIRQKQYGKMQELKRASHKVDVYENEIEIIQSLHKDCSDHIDWVSVEKSPKPEAPIKQATNEKKAKSKLDGYKAGFFDRLFKRDAKTISKLKLDIDKAVKADESEYSTSMGKYETLLKDWEESTALARRLLAGNSEAKIEAIRELNPFAEMSSLGSRIEIAINDSGQVEVVVNVHGETVVPKEVKSLLQSGKLSVKQMPKGRFNEIYQDYVCSCVLRVANELFAAIPDELVIVTAVDDLLNSKTGHLEKLPILSVCISRKTLMSLNMDAIDPSDSMKNFIHNMSFKKTTGFAPVSRVEFEQMQGA